jgi:PAS domain S-box-containing protein
MLLTRSSSSLSVDRLFHPQGRDERMSKDMTILHKVPSILVVLDQYGRTIDATDKALSEFPAANEGLNEVVNALHLDLPKTTILEAFEQRRGIKFFGRETGGTIWHCSLSFDAGSATTALAAEDVSEQYEEMLRERILLDLANKTPDYVGIADSNHRVLWVNESMRQVLNISDHNAEATHIEAVHRYGIGAYSVTAALEEAKRHGTLIDDTTLHDQRTGDAVEVSLVTSAHYDALNQQYFFSALGRDISDMRATERELRQTRVKLQQALDNTAQALQKRESEIDYSQEVWRSLVEYSQDLVLFTDQHGQVHFNNQGFLPENDQDLRQTSVFALFPEDDAASLAVQFRELIRGEREHVNAESDLVCEGTRKRCVILVNRLERASGSHAATWVISDATESHEAHQLAIAQEQMAATGRMAARVAHEINNPLAAIRSSLELIRLDHQAGAPVDDTMNLVNRELDRVSNIIRQMYGLYQPERDTVQPVDLTIIVSDTLRLLQSTARQRKIDLNCNCPHQLYALASEAGLRQVLFNLIQNALEASPAHEDVFVGIQEKDEAIIISVKDNGPGLPEDKALQVFEPFFTTRDSYNGQGLGLGLSVSSSLIKGMNGTLELQNRPEGGTQAVITLEAAPDTTSEED